MNSQSLENPFASVFGMSLLGLILALLTLLCIFFPPILLIAPLVGAGLMWAVLCRPVSMVGIVLAIMPFHFLAVMIGQFYGVPYIAAISGFTKEIVLLLLTFVLWRRNGYTLKAPDWFLLACLVLAALRTVFGGDMAGLRNDFQFVIPYLLGRVTILSLPQERLWARRAVWIVVLVSLGGMIESFVLGPAPRSLLYAVVSTDLVSTEPGRLPNSFYATGFEGLRAASTMVGPPSLGALCMVALIIWWVYLRNPLPAVLVGAGLICALTRSAWMGASVAICTLSLRSNQTRLLMNYALLALLVFAALFPVLGLGDYFSYTLSGQDESTMVHGESTLGGLEYIRRNPFGAGAGNVGPIAAQQDASVLIAESTYLAYAAQYGILAALCFLGFLASALWLVWKTQCSKGYLAAGILIGFSLMMTLFLIHEDFRLACWVWFPVGLSLRGVSGVRKNA